MSNDRPCEICGAASGDVFARRREDDARILVCYACFGRGIDEGTLVEQTAQAQPAIARADPLAATATAAPSPSAGSNGRSSIRIEQRDTGDLAIGFAVGFMIGLIGIMVMRLALSVDRRRDKIYGAWFGWAAGFGIGLLVYNFFG